mmetsp:Transcript_12723/g.29756  ORF Transcript_12723/g.29756 Transcript_12723/m.29756 type:complete len:125 (+) Transcript_12723:192-566(+)
MAMTKNYFVLALVVALAVVVSAFGPQHLPATVGKSTSARHGIFDKIVKSMESGYAGGEESPYAKIKEQDRLKEIEAKKRSQARKKRGYTELKDVKKKSFVKLKYSGAEEEEPPKEEKKKLFGLF